MPLRYAKAQRTVEVRQRKAANAVLWVGSYIRRVNAADRCRKTESAGKRRPSRHAVTCGTITKPHEVFPARDQCRVGRGSVEVFFPRGSVQNGGRSYRGQHPAQTSKPENRDENFPSHVGTNGPGDLR
jgi:hypothetical protein